MPKAYKESDFTHEEWKVILEKREKRNKYMREYHNKKKNDEEYKRKRKIDRDKFKQNHKEEIKKQNAEYWTRVLKPRLSFDPNFVKYRRITNWKQWGIISNDWEATHSKWLEATNCDFCKKEIDIKNKTLDHDHDITDKHNIRGILCRACNSQDKLKNQLKNLGNI